MSPSEKKAEESSAFDDNRKNLAVCLEHCECPNRFHPVWICMGASNTRDSVSQLKAHVAPILEPYLERKCSALIAGAADAETLRLVNDIARKSTWHYTVEDLCNAPLKLAENLAKERHLDVSTIRNNIAEASSAQTFDLVLVFSTFSFMDFDSRAQFFARIANSMSASGKIVCVMRYFENASTTLQETPGLWRENLTRKSLEYFDEAPNLSDGIKKSIAMLDSTRISRYQSQPTLADIESESSAAGFKVERIIDIPNPWQGEKAGKVFSMQKKVILVLTHND